MFGVPFNDAFLPGGFLDGSPDDIPPYNTITNLGVVTKQGAAGGVAGGGVRILANPGQAGAQKGVTFLPYGTQAEKKDKAGANWKAKVKKLADRLGVDPKEAEKIWREEGENLLFGVPTKLVKYTGDPLVSIPPDDLLLSQLDPLDVDAVKLALQDDNVIPIFWEVTGSRPMETLDILIGDLGLNSGYDNVLHHFPYIAVLDGVGPEDFGIDPAIANLITFDGSGLGGSGAFVGSMAISVADPAIVPLPASILLFLSGLAGLSLFGRLKRNV